MHRRLLVSALPDRRCILLREGAAVVTYRVGDLVPRQAPGHRRPAERHVETVARLGLESDAPIVGGDDVRIHNAGDNTITDVDARAGRVGETLDIRRSEARSRPGAHPND